MNARVESMARRRIWSLWDMPKADARLFIYLTKIMSDLRQSCIRIAPEEAELDKRERELVDGFLADAPKVRDELTGMGLPASAAAWGRLETIIGEGESRLRLIGRIDHFSEVFHDELDGVLLYQVPAKHAALMKSDAPAFGEAVFDAFPSAIADIEGAGKCLALGRGTASVFHLMRVMEAGLRVIGRALGIPYAPSWESYLKQIEAKITAKHATKTPRWKRDEPFYRDLAGDLHIVKIVWRNPTMHIVRHYTPEEADEIYRSVQTVMKRLATHLKEPRRR